MEALGFWGEEASSSIEPNIKDRILSLPGARELKAWEVPQPSVREVRKELGCEGMSDEELLLHFIVRDNKAIEAMRAAGPVREYPIASKSLLVLIEELMKHKDLSEVHIEKEDFSLRLRI